jgi:hypothetical protein
MKSSVLGPLVADRRDRHGHWAATGHCWDGPRYALYPACATAPGGRPYSRTSMRVFPSVLGFTRSRSRNSATPSS